MSDTVPGLVRRAAETFGDATAYSMDGRTLTFAELRDLVRQTAASYRSRGVESGSRVVLWAPNSIDWVVAGLAATYAGGIWCRRTRATRPTRSPTSSSEPTPQR